MGIIRPVVRRVSIVSGLLAGALVAVGAAPAEAQEAEHPDVAFDAHLAAGWSEDLGIGFRADVPVLSEGIIAGTDDDLRVSLGADLVWFFNHEGFGLYPVVALQWNFYLSPEWSIFPEVGMVLLFGEREHNWRTFVAPTVGFGVRWHWNESNALLIRLTWPTGLQLGIVF